jgi:serpin B
MSMKIHQGLSLTFVFSMLGLGCGSNSPASSGPGPDSNEPAAECHDPSIAGCIVASAKQRISNPAVSATNLKALTDGNTAFALDLYQRLRAEPGNLFYSPYSVSSALAMTFAGARGETAEQMASALHFTLPQDQLHAAFNALDQALASRGQGAEGQDGGRFRLNIANALWGQAGYSFAAPFLDVLAENYGAGMHILDFMNAPDKARTIVNDWVAERTEGKIKDILPDGSVKPSTRLVLTNAIYFNAAWRAPFDEGNTAPGTFTLLDGSTVSVPMMAASKRLPYGEGNGYAALELPYDGGELSMVLVLPPDLDAFEKGLSDEQLSSVFSSLRDHQVDVQLPKFKFETSVSLVDSLSDMGMPLAFSDAADLSGINGKGGLTIGDVLHKAYVSVNEKGTEAAAATAVIIEPTSLPQPATIRFDRPFLFFIRDIKTGTVLFVGRVSDPSAS